MKVVSHVIGHLLYFLAEFLGLADRKFDPRAGREFRGPAPSGGSCYPHYRRLRDEQLFSFDDVTIS